MDNLTHAQNLHRDAVVVDGHCDTVHLFYGLKGPYRFGAENAVGHVDLPRLRKGGVDVQFFALCVERRFKPCSALRRALVLLEIFSREMDENKDSVTVVLDKKGLHEALLAGKLAAVLTLEGGDPLEGEIEILHLFYKLGLRGLGLTWNERNGLADGVDVGSSSGGLTDLGRRVVMEMNRLGMLVDAAHLAERGFYELLELSTSPVIVSHANAAGVCSHRRNLTDDQLRALRDHGGVVGMTFYPPFVTGRAEAKLEDLLDHFCYVAERFGTDLLGLGSDFDGIPQALPELGDVSALPNLTEGLLRRGFSDMEVRLILGGNFLRVLEKNLR